MKNSVTIYPNPFSLHTLIHTDMVFNNATITLFNFSGQKVKQLKNKYGKNITVVRDNLSAGIYFLQVIQYDKVFIKKILISD